jgi:hypothetical protein
LLGGSCEPSRKVPWLLPRSMRNTRPSLWWHSAACCREADA